MDRLTPLVQSLAVSNKSLSLLVITMCAAAVTACRPASAAAQPPSQPAPAASPTPFMPAPVLDSSPSDLSVLPLPTFTPAAPPASSARASRSPSVVIERATASAGMQAIDPLTGLPVDDPSLLDRRPMVIKISNYPRDIRPQFGLNEADVVYEYYIEWMNTRFIAVFYGNDARQIGPVRSGRYFDEHMTRMYHAYYVFNYADPREYTYFIGSDLREFMVVPGYGSCPPFFQFRASTFITDLQHYETYFDSTRFSDCLARKSADNSRQVLRNGFFSTLPPSAGAEVSRIYTHYSRCDYNYWEYSAASDRYLRYQEISQNQKAAHINDCSDQPQTYAPLTDALTGRQVNADNIVVLYVAHTFNNENEQSDEIYHIDLVDSGRAYVFRDGLALPARWTRTDIDQPLLITDGDGNPIYLRPGRTFFQVIGETSHDWSDGQDWHFDFQTP